MGGGVSKIEYERIRKELMTKEQVIRTLQERLEETSRVSSMVTLSKSMQSSAGKVHRLSNAMATTHAGMPTFSRVSVSISEDAGEPPERLLSNNKRRVEVSAEVISNTTIMTKQRIVYPKTEAAKEALIKVLQSNVLFTGETRDEIRDCMDAFFPMKAGAGSIVIRQGDQGDHFYVVDTGQLEVLVAVNGSPTPIRYGFLGPGMGFGELALLCNMPRAATIRAVSEVSLWALERNIFREILASHKLQRINKAFQILQNVSILQKLTRSELHRVAAAMEWEEYDTNTTIIRQGEIGEHFYVITVGEIIVTQKDPDTGDQLQIRTLHAGDHFGEMALFKEETRSATCTAVGRVQCLSLGREHFIAMLGTIQELMDREPVMLEHKHGSNHMFSRQSLTDQLADQQSDYKYYMKIPKDELEILETLGRGAFGRVKLVRHAGSNSPYALKCLVKSRIVENNLKEHVVNEKRVMLSLDHPFILKLYNTYKDRKYIYFLVELALGGELFTYLRRKDRFDEQLARFYIASVVLVFEHMHSKKIAYRDLKPENILLDNEGFMKLADFGLAKLVMDRTWTLCGTPDYLAPEIILNKGHDRAVDYWALGILMFELIAGSAPFYAQDPMQIYALIIQGNLKFPVHFRYVTVITLFDLFLRQC